MKTYLLAATIVLVAAAAVPAQAANTKSYVAICQSIRLTQAERNACRAEMRAATTDSERTRVFRMYDLRTIGYAADGRRLSEKPIQEAEAVAK